VSERRTEHERLETSLELHRRELQAAVDELKQSTQAWVAPRGVVARHPYPVVAAAFLAGLWLARR
jgi:hypothetical protein